MTDRRKQTDIARKQTAHRSWLFHSRRPQKPRVHSPADIGHETGPKRAGNASAPRPVGAERGEKVRHLPAPRHPPPPPAERDMSAIIDTAAPELSRAPSLSRCEMHQLQTHMSFGAAVRALHHWPRLCDRESPCMNWVQSRQKLSGMSTNRNQERFGYF